MQLHEESTNSNLDKIQAVAREPNPVPHSLFCDNRSLPFPDVCIDAIITNGTPIDVNTWLGPGVQTSEILRVLRPGGTWHDNGILVLTSP